MQKEVTYEKQHLLQSEKATPSQKRASEKIKRAIDKKRED